MNEQIERMIEASEVWNGEGDKCDLDINKFVTLLHRTVIASILITDVVMEEKGETPTSEDYIRSINHDLGFGPNGNEYSTEN